MLFPEKSASGLEETTEGARTSFRSTQRVVVAPPPGLARHSAATAAKHEDTRRRALGSAVPKYSANL